MTRYPYNIRGIQVEIVDPVPTMGRSYGELEKTAEIWANYAEQVSKPGVAKSVTVLCDEHGVVRPSVVRKGEA